MTSGLVFWILVALAAFAVVTYIGRLIDLRRAQIDYQDFLKGVYNVLDAGREREALAICEDTFAPVAQVVATAVRHRAGSARLLREAVDSKGRSEIGRLDRRLATLAIIAQIAPAIGILGTIIGFIKTVVASQSHVLVTRTDLMSGSLEALATAALGLAVSIAATVMYGSLRIRLDRTVVDLEAAASQIVGYLSALKEKEQAR